MDREDFYDSFICLFDYEQIFACYPYEIIDSDDIFIFDIFYCEIQIFDYLNFLNLN